MYGKALSEIIQSTVEDLVTKFQSILEPAARSGQIKASTEAMKATETFNGRVAHSQTLRASECEESYELMSY